MKPGYIFINLMRLVMYLLLPATVQAQSVLKGEVRDSSNAVLSFATVHLSLGDSVIGSVVSDDAGRFSMNVPAHSVPVTVVVSYIGLEPYRLSAPISRDTVIDVVLGGKARQLQGVTVTAQQPLIVRRADRYVINVEQSFLSSGYSASEILARSPGLWIDNEGVIRLRGNRAISVMVNGVLQRMSYQELQDYLKSLRSESISKIEVITSAGAQFDAEGAGGFVNIITKKVRTLGWQGNVAGTYRQQGAVPYAAPSLSLSYKLNKLSFSGSYAYVYDRKKYVARNEITYPDATFLNTYTDVDDTRKRHQAALGVNYDISDRQSLGIQNLFTQSNADNVFSSLLLNNFRPGQSEGTALARRERSFRRNSTTANYRLRIDTFGSTLTVIGDFTSNNVLEHFRFDSRFQNSPSDSSYRNVVPFKTSIGTGQVDFKKVFRSKLELLTGAKYSGIHRDNDLASFNSIDGKWEQDSLVSNHFVYDEQILALYALVNRQLGKTGLSAGLRAEQTWSSGSSLTSGQRFSNPYLRVFPSLSLERILNEKQGHSMAFAFTSRLNRPDFNDLNPYRIRIDNFTYQTGNPDLRPQYSYNFDLSATLFREYSAGVYYNLVQETFANLLTPKGGNIIEYQVRNFDRAQEWGLYTTMPVKITKWWTTRTDLTAYFLRYQLEQYRNSAVTFLAHTVHNVHAGKVADFDLIADYRSPYVYSNAEAAYQFYLDIGCSRKVLKDKGRLRLLVTDVFNTLRDQADTRFNNTNVHFYQKRPTRTVSLSFSYSFSRGARFNNRNIQQAGNEEKSRLDR